MGMNQMTTKSFPPNKTNPYVESGQHRLNPWIPKDGEIHRSLEFAFDPGDFACDPSKIVAHRCDHGVCIYGG